MDILALNCGSSSLKYQVINPITGETLVGGNVEKIGRPDSFVTQKYPNGNKETRTQFMPDHSVALSVVHSMLENAVDLKEIVGVGHRVVMGGEKLTNSVKIDAGVKETIGKLGDLAPLHNPAALNGIGAAEKIFPNAAQVAVFDTAFFKDMPEYTYRYAIPNVFYNDYGVRKYGFHGTSHLYASKRAAALLHKDAKDVNLVSAHIGSGASIATIKNGRGVDTSMGMTPLAGVVMGTRAGDIDAGVVLYQLNQPGMTVAKLNDILNKQSGIYGISGGVSDDRVLTEGRDTNKNYDLALKMQVHSIKKHIGSAMATLGRVDGIVFTAGIGENSAEKRAEICDGMADLGIKIDADKNNAALGRLGVSEAIISTPDSRIPVLMIATNEELVIAEDVRAIIEGTYNPDHLKMVYSFAGRQR